MIKKNVQRSSDILLEILNRKDLKNELTFQDILHALGERAFGIVLLFFALPSALPLSTIPGVSVIFSLPILIFACQMIFARKALWLPKMIGERTVKKETISKVIKATVPYLKKIEFLLKPRWSFMTSRFMDIINGVAILCLSLFLMLPIPFSNFIFAALLIVFSLGLVEKDGFLLVIGYIGVAIYASVMYVVLLGIIKHFLI